MTDEQVSGEFRFDVTGNGLKKLADLDALLKSVNSIGLVATKSVAKMTAAFKAEEAAVWKASAAYRSYTASINKAVKAHNDLRKAAGTGAVIAARATPVARPAAIAHVTSRRRSTQRLRWLPQPASMKRPPERRPATPF